jgi:hypothetical protein
MAGGGASCVAAPLPPAAGIGGPEPTITVAVMPLSQEPRINS